MTLLFMDGFDAGDAGIKWGGFTGSSSTVTRYGRGRSVSLVVNQEVTTTILPSSRVVAGFSYQPNNATARAMLHLGAAGVWHVGLRRNQTTGLLELYRGNTLILTTSSVLEVSSWYYIEVEATLADAGGIVKVWVDDVLVIDFVGDTRNGGTATAFDAVGIPYPQSAVYTYCYVDDFYILNTEGIEHNSRLGEISIQTLVPTGPGSLTEQTPVGSASNWQNVDNVPYSTSAYNYATADNTSDLYTASDALASLPDVLAIAPNLIAVRTDPGAGNVRSLLKTGETVVTGPTTSLTSNITARQDLIVNNPATGLPWTVAELNAVEIGSEVL